VNVCAAFCTFVHTKLYAWYTTIFFIRHDDRAEKIFNFNLLIAACKARRNLPFCLITLMSVCKGSCTGLTWKVGPISHEPHWCCWWWWWWNRHYQSRITSATQQNTLSLLLYRPNFYQQKSFCRVYLLCTHLNNTAQHRYMWNFCCVMVFLIWICNSRRAIWLFLIKIIICRTLMIMCLLICNEKK